MIEKSKNDKKYFAAANSGDGFINYYKHIFDSSEFDSLAIVKGGSGTGKSSFLRKLTSEGEKEGYFAEFFYCSSDPTSLDGVILQNKNGRRIAAIDGTAPHMRDTEFPGCCDFIHNTGAYWNSEILHSMRGKISELIKSKQLAFTRAYEYLSAASKLNAIGDNVSSKYINLDKMSAAVKRLLGRAKTGNGKKTYRLLDSFGMNGYVKFDTFGKEAETVYRVIGQGAREFISEIKREAESKNLDMVISPYHLDTSKLSAIFLPEISTAFIYEARGYSVPDDERMVNMERFVCGMPKEQNTEYRRVLRLKSESLALAKYEFEKIKKLHFELENIYSSTMDFDRKEKDEMELISKIFNY